MVHQSILVESQDNHSNQVSGYVLINASKSLGEGVDNQMVSIMAIRISTFGGESCFTR